MSKTSVPGRGSPSGTMGSEKCAVTCRTSLTVPRGEKVTRRGSAAKAAAARTSTTASGRTRRRCRITTCRRPPPLFPFPGAQVERDEGEGPGEVVELVDLHGEGDALGELAGGRSRSVRHRGNPEAVEHIAVAPHARDLRADRLQRLAEDRLVRSRDHLGEELRVLALHAGPEAEALHPGRDP